MIATNYAEPILYLIDVYTKNDNVLKANEPPVLPDNTTTIPDAFLDSNSERNLANYPVQFIRQSGLITAILYGDPKNLSTETWRQDFIRERGIITKMVTTYEDGESFTTLFNRQAGSITNIDIE